MGSLDPICSFFIVLHGAVQIEERQVHHQEGRHGSEGFKRIVNCRRGKAFGHFPLVFGESKYDYTARVEAAASRRKGFLEESRKHAEKRARVEAPLSGPNAVSCLQCDPSLRGRK